MASDALLEHFKHPRNAGVFSAAELRVSRVQVGCAKRRALIALQLKFAEDGAIAAARFQAYGCAATLAAASWISAWLPGKSPHQAQRLHDSDIIAALALPPEKMHCAVLAQQAVLAALDARRVQDD